MLDGEFHAESLEVYDEHKHEHGGQEVGHVGQVLAVESLLQSADLVLLGDEQMEERNDGSFKFSSTTSVDGGRAERFPDDGLAHIGGNEKRDGRAETVSLLQELIETDDQDTGGDQLANDEDRIARSEILDIAVHAREHVSDSFHDSDDDTEELLGSLEESLVLLGSLINVDDFGSRKQLHDETRGNNRADTELHEGTLVRGEDDTHPVEGI